MQHARMLADWELAERLCASCRHAYFEQHNLLAYLTDIGRRTDADIPDEAHWQTQVDAHCSGLIGNHIERKSA